jgi:predicted permease
VSGSARRGWQRLLAFFRKEEMDSELSAEIASHLEMAIDENLQKGMPPEEARRQALIKLGGMQQARERHAEARGLPWLDILVQDLRYTFRTLRRDRTFAVVAVLILALGIGANVVIFSVVNTILLRPLPFRDPDKLLWIAPAASTTGWSSVTYSADAFDEFKERNRSYEDVSGYFAFSSSDNVKLTGGSIPQPATEVAVINNFFQVLGVEPYRGRWFVPEEGLPGGPPAVVLSYSFWKRRFAGNPSIVGTAISIDNSPVNVVGIMPESFDYGAVFSPGSRVDMIAPIHLDDARDWGNIVTMIGRLKPGVTLEQARSEAAQLVPTLDFNRKHPDWKDDYTAWPRPLKEYVSGKLRRSLIVLWSAVGLILLIVCVNLSNLLLARAAARSKEFAMRSALGASRGRLVRQLLTESFVLSTAGALLGLVLAYSGTFYLAHQGSLALPLLSSVRVDAAALGWTLLVATAAALIFGLAPGMRMSGGNFQEALKDGVHTASAGRRHEQMRSALVIAEVALACVLLIGAGLLLRSFLRVLDVDLGFRPTQASAVKVDYDLRAKPEKRGPVLENILARVSAIPGVEAAGITDNLPMEGNRSWGAPHVQGAEIRKDDHDDAFVYIITPGYFRAMGATLRGRDFTWQDDTKHEMAIVLNETTAHKLWPNQDPIGQMVDEGGREARVIGVVSDMHESNVESAPGMQMYFTASQAGPDGAELVIRSRQPAASLAPLVMRTLREINPGQPAFAFRPVQSIVDHAVSPRRFFVMLVTSFAALGLILASLGIYGVISYSVARQTQEIGIRMALGATAGRVQRNVLGKTLRLTAIGIVVGAIASFLFGRAITSMLYDTNPGDPMTFLNMTLLLAVVALLAGYLPARRASRIHPMVALRNN